MPKSSSIKIYLRSAIFQYIIFTVYWIIMTQWFLGASIFEMVYRTTSKCELVAAVGTTSGASSSVSYSKRQCIQDGGVWTSGIDISGHCFILIHSCNLLLRLLSLLRKSLSDGGSGRQTASKKNDDLVNITTTSNKSIYFHRSSHGIIGSGSLVTAIAMGVCLFLVGLWTIMLLSTSLFFHSITEKLLGAAIAVVFSLVI